MKKPISISKAVEAFYEAFGEHAGAKLAAAETKFEKITYANGVSVILADIEALIDEQRTPEEREEALKAEAKKIADIEAFKNSVLQYSEILKPNL